MLKIEPAECLERRYYGYDEKNNIATEAKEALKKYVVSEAERYETIKKWVKQATKDINGQELIVEYDKIFKYKGEV